MMTVAIQPSAKVAPKPATPADAFRLPEKDLRDAEITIRGESPLIVHAWSAKARQMMLDAQTGKAKTKKEAKNPEQDFQDSLYKIIGKDGAYGFPVTGVKKAVATTWDQVEGIKKKSILAAFHINSPYLSYDGLELTELVYDELVMREDVVRLQGLKADLRYRGEFRNWSTTFNVQYNNHLLNLEQLTHLLDLAGFGVGLGEWRPQRGGSYGRFEVAEIQEFAKAAN